MTMRRGVRLSLAALGAALTLASVGAFAPPSANAGPAERRLEARRMELRAAHEQLREEREEERELNREIRAAEAERKSMLRELADLENIAETLKRENALLVSQDDEARAHQARVDELMAEIVRLRKVLSQAAMSKESF